MRIKIASLLVLAVLTASGCGGSGGDSSSQPTPSEPASPTTPPETSPPGETTEWVLVWQDEFDGNALSSERWSHEVNCWGGGNNEKQCYTDRSDNLVVKDGFLNIIARQESFTGPAETEDSPDYNVNVTRTLPYTSARIRTKFKGDWLYGRFEVRAKLPSGQGTWPAFWMLPTDYVYGGWAASGEIDIMEAVNLKTVGDDNVEESGVHGTLHYGRAWPENVYSGAEFQVLPNPAEQFHLYAIEWQEGEIRWYVNDIHYATHTEEGWFSQYFDDKNQLITGSGSAPFDQRFHLILNLAIGGNWPESVNQTGIDTSTFPQIMEIDYVRVYECAISPNNGAGCATIGDTPIYIEGNRPQ
ncbi:glycoside hydrolase family 16 protein [Thalassotalea litorea]|uniref:glycoside hydrolase family 16 protein n=1 Tax=Thalassotalea litorea TaxID=2020715 RepID=UPI0037365DB0